MPILFRKMIFWVSWSMGLYSFFRMQFVFCRKCFLARYWALETRSLREIRVNIDVERLFTAVKEPVRTTTARKKLRQTTGTTVFRVFFIQAAKKHKKNEHTYVNANQTKEAECNILRCAIIQNDSTDCHSSLFTRGIDNNHTREAPFTAGGSRVPTHTPSGRP